MADDFLILSLSTKEKSPFKLEISLFKAPLRRLRLAISSRCASTKPPAPPGAAEAAARIRWKDESGFGRHGTGQDKESALTQPGDATGLILDDLLRRKNIPYNIPYRFCVCDKIGVSQATGFCSIIVWRASLQAVLKRERERGREGEKARSKPKPSYYTGFGHRRHTAALTPPLSSHFAGES